MRRLAAIGFFLFATYLIISFSRSVWDLWQKQGEIEKTKAKVEDLKAENNRLKGQLEYTKTDEFVEKEARDKLNLVRPGETVVMIPDSVLKAATAAASPTPPPPNWEQWMRLFF